MINLYHFNLGNVNLKNLHDLQRLTFHRSTMAPRSEEEQQCCSNSERKKTEELKKNKRGDSQRRVPLSEDEVKSLESVLDYSGRRLECPGIESCQGRCESRGGDPVRMMKEIRDQTQPVARRGWEGLHKHSWRLVLQPICRHGCSCQQLLLVYTAFWSSFFVFCRLIHCCHASVFINIVCPAYRGQQH